MMSHIANDVIIIRVSPKKLFRFYQKIYLWNKLLSLAI